MAHDTQWCIFNTSLHFYENWHTTLTIRHYPLYVNLDSLFLWNRTNFTALSVGKVNELTGIAIGTGGDSGRGGDWDASVMELSSICTFASSNDVVFIWLENRSTEVNVCMLELLCKVGISKLSLLMEINDFGKIRLARLWSSEILCLSFIWRLCVLLVLKRRPHSLHW